MSRIKVSDIAAQADLSNPSKIRRQDTGMHGTKRKDRSAISEAKRQSDERKELSKENITISPDNCYISPLNRRRQDLVKQEEYQDKIDDFLDPTIGQIEPIIIRYNPKDGKEWEVLAGSLRHAAATWVASNTSVDFKLKAQIRECTDREAAIISNKENSSSIAISPYENAIGTKKEIETLYNGIVAEYCRANGENEATVNQLLAFNQIPTECLEAYSSPKIIPVLHVITIRSSLAKNKGRPEYLKALLAEAKRLSALPEKLDSKQTLKRMIDAAGQSLVKGKKVEAKKTDITIAGDKKGIQISVTPTGITTIRLNKTCNSNHTAAKEALLKYIDEAFSI